MDHAAVMARLLAGNGRFFFEDDHVQRGLAQQKFARGSQADDTRADNGQVVVAGRWSWFDIMQGIFQKVAPLEVLMRPSVYHQEPVKRAG